MYSLSPKVHDKVRHLCVFIKVLLQVFGTVDWFYFFVYVRVLDVENTNALLTLLVIFSI